MKPVRLLPVLSLVLFAILGCESGTSFELAVDASLEPTGSVEAPLLIRAGVDQLETGTLTTAVIGVDCGTAVRVSSEWRQDNGFGCLDEEFVGREVPAFVWIEPTPPEWDLEAVCTLSARENGVFNTSPALPVAAVSDTAGFGDSGEIGDSGELADTADTAEATLDHDGLALTPDPSWPQAEGSVTWARDGSPCGGHASGSVRFAP